MKKNLIIAALIATHAYAETIDMNAIQQKNLTYLNSVMLESSESRVKLYSGATANIESAQRSNIEKLAKAKPIKSSFVPPLDYQQHKVDVNELITQTNSKVLNIDLTQHNVGIYLFLTFAGLPDDAVVAYISQANKYKIPIVLVGWINNSYQETAKFLQKFRTLYPNLSVLIDPPSYEKYNITVAPTLVVVENKKINDLGDCSAVGHDKYTKISGEVSIQALLNHVVKYSSNPVLVKAAGDKLNEVKQQRYFN